jgi:hypothetical protein
MTDEKPALDLYLRAKRDIDPTWPWQPHLISLLSARAGRTVASYSRQLYRVPARTTQPLERLRHELLRAPSVG